ncbi:hypothetical protein HYX10_03810 [Candidatus Woesearchaeota archaeon]|nr:hypothetical protein [Candidatus Woesearchaeota archaeon]
MRQQSLVTPIVRGSIFLASAAMVLYTAVAVGNPFSKTASPTEPGFVNAKYVAFESPVNEKGNAELYINYDNGEAKAVFPVREGPFGPLVGDANYHWRSMDSETRSALVERDFSSLQLDAQKRIFMAGLERMIENYDGGASNDSN